MADTKISALPAVTAPASTDEFAVNQGGTSKKVTAALIESYFETRGFPMVAALTSDETTNTSVTPAKQTGLDMTLPTGTYQFQYYVRYQTAATATGIRFDVNHSGTVTAFVWNQRWVDVSATASTATPDQDAIIAAGQVMGAFGSRAKGTAGRGTTLGVDTQNADMLMVIEGLCIVTVSGDLQLYMGTEIAASGATVKAGSSLVVVRVA